MNYIRILAVFAWSISPSFIASAQTNACIAQPCHCDGTCGDACLPFDIDEVDFDETSSFDLSLSRKLDDGAVGDGSLSTSSVFEVHHWQLDEDFDAARLEEYVSEYLPGLEQLASAAEGIATDELSVALFSQIERNVGAADGDLARIIDIEEFDPRRSIPVLDNIAIGDEEFTFLEQFLPDVRPTDPGMGGGVGVDDQLSDVIKQTDPDDILRCKASVEHVLEEPPNLCRQIVSRLCEGGCSNEELSDRLNDPERSVYVKGLLATYDNQCLDRFDREDPASTAEFDVNYVLARSGALFINPDGASPLCTGRLTQEQNSGAPFVFCSAAVLDQNKLVTARHCLRNNKRNTTASYCLASGAVEFRTFAEPDRVYGVSALTREQATVLRARKRVSEDYAELYTETPIARIGTGTEQERPGAYASALIMGFHNLVANNREPSSESWAGKVRWSRPYCSFVRSSGACAVTKCQTIGGFSGVPVWSVNDSGETKLSGIQIEGGSASFGACLDRSHAQTLGSQGNLAISTFIEE